MPQHIKRARHLASRKNETLRSISEDRSDIHNEDNQWAVTNVLEV
jgi:hypothetical protein